MQTVAEIHEPDSQFAKRDLYKEVTEKIIGMIELGVAPWRRTWSTYGLARNYATGHIYTGINLLLMNNTSHLIPYFMTYAQVKERGGNIRKGAKAEMVIYFNVYYKDANDQTLEKEAALTRKHNGEEIQILKFIRYYNVFNIADIEGIEFEIREVILNPNEKIAACERIVTNMPNPPEIKVQSSNRAFYSPIFDFIVVPVIEQFESAEAYYAALFHELIHSTGHIKRLGREEVVNLTGFGSVPYCREELVAEMGASFLCSMAQIDYDSITQNSAAYLSGWLTKLREDSRFIFKVAAEAQKGVECIVFPK